MVNNHIYLPYTSKIVHVGDIPLGGDYPIRIQSMTNTNTLDTSATVRQIIELHNLGCEYVRMTTRNLKEAENLSIIKTELSKQGYFLPLIADIHFNHEIAEKAAKTIEKIRINPGNLFSNNSSKNQINSNNELENIHTKIKPLLKICNDHGTVIRIGVNHGSLSNRVVEKHGNTADGMVKSALEYIEICEDHQFYNMVISMKSSDIKTMIFAYRKLAASLKERNSNYPLHLGVTEAGEGEDGIIRSAAGTGTLLSEGLGDTIRVSLTGNPINEIPVAKKLVGFFPKVERDIKTVHINKSPFSYSKRKTINIKNIIGGELSPIVVGKKNEKSLTPPDYLYSSIKESFIEFSAKSINEISFQKIRTLKNKAIILKFDSSEIKQCYDLFNFLIKENISIPVILRPKFNKRGNVNFQLFYTSTLSRFFIDGLANGLFIESENIKHKNLISFSFDLLQATGSRYTKIEYISCPTCGRTGFDINKAVAEIKAKTKHLKGIKIAIMGCIVNGPGEMEDADYGYVGSAKGKVNLYKGNRIAFKNIDENLAICRLLELIDGLK